MDGLGISLELLIAQLINFLILFGLLYAFAYKPFMRILDERSATVKEKIDKADHLKDQAAEAEEGKNESVKDRVGWEAIGSFHD